MNKFQRKNIQTLKPYKSARDLYKDGILLDANENFKQWVKIDWKKIKNLNRYGDSTCKELREKLSKNYINGFTKDNIFIGAGSNEIIDLLIRGFVEPEESILIIEPNYSIYETQANIAGVGCKKIKYNNKLDIVISDIKKNIEKVKMLFLCSPDNPTGHIIHPIEIKKILKFFNGIIVIDEAYIEFAGMEKSLLNFGHLSNVVIMRSFSKAWGLAGIRIGYAVANKKIINVLLKIKNSYNVSRISQSIAIQALDQINKLYKNIDKSNKLKKQLVKNLKKLPIKIINTNANYILIRLNKATKIQKLLAENKIIIRDRSKLPLLENTLRITIGNKNENKKLTNELSKIISNL